MCVITSKGQISTELLKLGFADVEKMCENFYMNILRPKCNSACISLSIEVLLH